VTENLSSRVFTAVDSSISISIANFFDIELILLRKVNREPILAPAQGPPNKGLVDLQGQDHGGAKGLFVSL
jgi:hypothetical protein